MKTLVAMAFALACLAASAQEFAMKRDGAVSWICGGVGADERRAIEALKPQARIEVEFVTAKRGAYLSDVRLAMYDARGERVLEVAADGPVCLIDAPAGTYRLEARYEGVTRKARSTIAGAATPRRVVFAFPGEPWDGIRASPEEKAQAAQP